MSGAGEGECGWKEYRWAICSINRLKSHISNAHQIELIEMTIRKLRLHTTRTAECATNEYDYSIEGVVSSSKSSCTIPCLVILLRSFVASSDVYLFNNAFSAIDVIPYKSMEAIDIQYIQYIYVSWRLNRSQIKHSTTIMCENSKETMETQGAVRFVIV